MTLDKPKNNESKIEKKIQNNQDMFDDIASRSWNFDKNTKNKGPLEIKDISGKVFMTFEKYIYPRNSGEARDIGYIFEYTENGQKKIVEYAGKIGSDGKIDFFGVIYDEYMSKNINPELHTKLLKGLDKGIMDATTMDIIKKYGFNAELSKTKSDIMISFQKIKEQK